MTTKKQVAQSDGEEGSKSVEPLVERPFVPGFEPSLQQLPHAENGMMKRRRWHKGEGGKEGHEL